MSGKKRKVDEESEMYQEEWRKQYFFGEINGKPICLICRAHEQEGANENNIRKHYNTYHAKEYDKFIGKLREDKVTLYGHFVKKENPVSESDGQVSDAANRASYSITREIAAAAMPLSIAGILKKCMLVTAGAICPDKRQEFAEISLSKHSITERVNELADDVNSQLKSKVGTFIAISVAIEKTSLDCHSPLAVFIRGVDKDFEVTEEFVDLISGDMTSDGIFKSLGVALENIGVDWAHIVCMVTSREPSALEGVATKIKEKLHDRVSKQQFSHLHCLVHQEMLENFAMKMSNVMDVLQKTTSLLKTQLPHQHRLLFRLNTHRGLMGSLLKDFYALRPKILEVVAVQELQDIKWQQDLAFMIDIKGHFDDLMMQEQRWSVVEFYACVCDFQMKLKLCKNEMTKKNLKHFPTLRSLCHENGFLCSAQSKKYISTISKLQEELQDAFSDLKNFEKFFKVFQNPFTINLDEVPVYLVCEIIEMQYDTALQHKFSSVDIQTFYKDLGVSYSRVKHIASVILSMFCTTCVCKKPFSTTFKKYSQHRNIDKKSALRLATAKMFSPNIDELVIRRKYRKAAVPVSNVAHRSNTGRMGNSASIGIFTIDLCSSDDECFDITENPEDWRDRKPYLSGSKEFLSVSEEKTWIKKEPDSHEDVKIKEEPI